MTWDVREFHCWISLCLFAFLHTSLYVYISTCICLYTSVCVCIYNWTTSIWYQEDTAEVLDPVRCTQLGDVINCGRFLIAWSFPWLFTACVRWKLTGVMVSQRIQTRTKLELSLILGIFAELGIIRCRLPASYTEPESSYFKQFAVYKCLICFHII